MLWSSISDQLANVTRFLWVYLVLDIIVHECDKPSKVENKLKALPGELEDIYLECLDRKHGLRSACNPILLILLSVAPEPMHELAVREFLALNLKSGGYNKDDLENTKSLERSGVSLVAVDENDATITLVHESIRTFILSTTALDHAKDLLLHSDHYINMKAWTEHTLEEAATNHLGFVCLKHIQYQMSQSPARSPPQYVEVPTMWSNFSSLTRVFFPRTAKMPTASLRLSSPRAAASWLHTNLLDYAIRNWIACHRYIRKWQVVDDRNEIDTELPSFLIREEHHIAFTKIAMEPHESWRLYPWRTRVDLVQHLLEMYAFSVANGHHALLSLVLTQKRSLPENIWSEGLEEHEDLPALHVACKAGHAHIIRVLLDVCDHHSRCHKFKTPLHYAAQHGHWQCIEPLLTTLLADHKDYLNMADGSKRTPLDLAAMYGHEVFVSYLLSHGADPLAKHSNSEHIALHYAAKHGHAQCVEALLRDLSAAVRHECLNTGESLLHLAAARGHIGVVNRLLNFGANRLSKDQSGMTPAMLALEKGHSRLSELLVTSEELMTYWMNRDRHGRNALISAATKGETTMVQMLCSFSDLLRDGENGARNFDIHDRDDDGLTALWYACRHGHDQVATILLEHAKFNKEKEFTVANRQGETCFAIAARHGHFDIVRTLLKTAFHAQCLCKDKSGWLPVERAVHYQQTELVGELALASVQVLQHSDSESFATTLHAAAQVGHVSAILGLLRLHQGEHFVCPLGSANAYQQRHRVEMEESFSLRSLPFPLAAYLARANGHKNAFSLLTSDAGAVPTPGDLSRQALSSSTGYTAGNSRVAGGTSTFPRKVGW